MGRANKKAGKIICAIDIFGLAGLGWHRNKGKGCIPVVNDCLFVTPSQWHCSPWPDHVFLIWICPSKMVYCPVTNIKPDVYGFSHIISP
jgi:hypothetical protein